MQSPLQMFQKAFPISYFAKEDSSYAFCNNSKYLSSPTLFRALI